MSFDYSSLPALTRARGKAIADLDRASARRTEGLFRIEGWRSLASAVAAGRRLEEIVVTPDTLTEERIALIRSADAGLVARVAPKGMARLTSVVQDQGVVATARITTATARDVFDAHRLICLDGVQDPGNVGTLIRTAAWFAVDGILAGNGTADFYNPKVVRSAAGAIWDVALVRSDSLEADLKSLKAVGFSCFAADMEGAASPDWTRHGRAVLVLGSEGHGISKSIRALADGLVRVPSRRDALGGVESLNVAAAGSILMARWFE